MDGNDIQKKIYSGYEKAVQRLGVPFNQVRPSVALNPIAIVQNVQKAAFSPDGKFLKPAGYGKPVWQALVDGRKTEVGDYFVGADATFFIIAMQALLPILAVKCNHVISVSTAASNAGIGAQPYGGNTLAGQHAYLSGWPASILQGPKGERSETNLPGDVKNPWWVILLPSFSGVLINTTDIVTDENEDRYVISSNELTDMGWRLTAQLQVT